MKTDMKMTIELSPEEIKKAIVAYIKLNSGLADVTLTESNVTFQIRKAERSDDPRESIMTAALTGAKAKITFRPVSHDYMDR